MRLQVPCSENPISRDCVKLIANDFINITRKIHNKILGSDNDNGEKDNKNDDDKDEDDDDVNDDDHVDDDDDEENVNDDKNDGDDDNDDDVVKINIDGNNKRGFVGHREFGYTKVNPKFVGGNVNRDGVSPALSSNITHLSSTDFIDIKDTTSIDLNNPEVILNMNATPIATTHNKNSDVAYVLNNLKIENTNRLVIGHLNINSLRNKFEALKLIVNDNLDILIISETKLDDTFPVNQFTLDGYNHFRVDKNSNSGGIIIFIREDVPCKKITITEWPSDLEGIFIEINLRKIKWLLFGGYNPHKQIISQFLYSLSKCIEKLMIKYDNIVLLGDFNSELFESDMLEFCNVYGLKNLIKEPTCYKNALNPTCIDLILTNKFNKFQNSKTIETGLSDFHKMTVTVLKTFFQKKAPTLIKYRNYKKIDNDNFRNELKLELLKYQINEITYDEFKGVFMNTLSKHAPIKEKLIRANNAPFMNKTLTKSVMIRSRLRNIFNKNPSVENETAYKIQRNLCVKLFRNAKKEYYGNLDNSILSDNKKFWEVMKPLFSEKQKIIRKIILIDDDKVIYNDQDIAEKMNNFFITAVSKLCIEDQYANEENVHNEYNSIILKIVAQYKNHPSICKIKENISVNEKFSFNTMSTDQVENVIKNLNTHKATQCNDIPAKIIVKSSDIVSPYLSNIYTRSIQNYTFPNALKEADVTPIHKKGDRILMENYRPVSILPNDSKIYERNMYDQIYSYFEKYISPYLCGFRKGYSTQHCLAIMIESWKKAIDKKIKMRGQF